jgi:hypothetical protein
MTDRSGECWLFLGPTPRGYGVFTVAPRRYVRAHRYAWELANGRPPTDDEVVRHLCEDRYPPGDNTHKRCVFPGHLAVGTPAQNRADALTSGRLARGERSRAAVLTADDVREIRRLAIPGAKRADIAARFGITVSTVGNIAAGWSWRHVV